MNIKLQLRYKSWRMWTVLDDFYSTSWINSVVRVTLVRMSRKYTWRRKTSHCCSWFSQANESSEHYIACHSVLKFCPGNTSPVIFETPMCITCLEPVINTFKNGISRLRGSLHAMMTQIFHISSYTINVQQHFQDTCELHRAWPDGNTRSWHGFSLSYT
jgi:hypothetical protein